MTGKVRTFEEFFGMQIRLGADHAYEFIANNIIIGHELAGDDLPEDLREFVQSVVFASTP